MTRLTKNIIFNLVGQGLVLALSLLAVRFIFRRLGDDAFGIIFFNLILTSVLTQALELGVSSTIVREVSSHFESNRGYVRDLIRTASMLYWVSGFAAVLIIWIFAPFLVTHWVNLRTIDPSGAATMLRLLSGTALVALPKSLYTSLFRGRQMMGLNNVIDVSTATTQQLGIVAILGARGNVYMVSAWISASSLVGISAYIVVAARQVGWSALRPALAVETMRRNVGFTGQMMLMSLLSLVHIQTVQVIVSKLLPVAEFGVYGFAASSVNRASVVTSAIAQAAFPSLSRLFAAGDRQELVRQYGKLHDLVCYGALPLFAGLCFAATPVYTYVFNPRVADELLLPTAFLALGTWMNATLNMPYLLTLAMGKPQMAVRMNLYAVLVVLPVTALLIFRFALAGAGFSWVFYHLFFYAYFVPRLSRECLQSSTWAWYLHVAKVLGLAAVTYGLAWLLVLAVSPFSVAAVVIAYAAATLAYGIGAFVMIGSDLRATVVRFQHSFLVRRADRPGSGQ